MLPFSTLDTQGPLSLYPNVAYLRQGKTRKSAPDVAAHRLGQVEAYLTVREVLCEASTAADGVLSRERSGSYRCRYATLGLRCLEVFSSSEFFLISLPSRAPLRVPSPNPCQE